MTRILHFGPGNFARAHLVEYTQDAGDWEITAVSLRSRHVHDALVASGGAYTLAVQGAAHRQISAITQSLHAPSDPGAVLRAIADPQTQIISATVTEKGYAFDAADIKATPPGSFLGYLAHGLQQRRAPVTLLSCDNGTSNGARLEAALQQFCAAAGLTLPCKITCPNAMVDRITPATTDALRAQTGDPVAVPCEPFKEWVIEDRFAATRPDWPGVQWVADVAPHEMRKLRLLNGAHSYLAYAGVLAGYDFVHEAVGDPALRAGARAVMQEAAQTLPAEAQTQAGAYADALIARFENPHLNHALRQIAMDGTQKLPYRMVAALRERRDQGLASPALKAGIAAWIAFCRAETAAGRALQDPQADALAQAGPDAAFLTLIEAADLIG